MAKNYHVDYSNNNPKLIDEKGNQIGGKQMKLKKQKPTHILRHIAKVNHETAGGPKPKPNDWYYESYADNMLESLKEKPNAWDVMKQTAKSPEDIKAIRETINNAYKRNPNLVSKEDMKYVAKKPTPIKPLIPLSPLYDWRLAPWYDFPEDDDAKPKPEDKTRLKKKKEGITSLI